MRSLILSVFFFPVIALAASAGEVNDCEIVAFPKIQYGYIEKLQNSIEAERANAMETTDESWRQIYQRTVLEQTQMIYLARLNNAILRRDFDKYGDALNKLNSYFPNNRYPQGFGISTLETYLVAYELGFNGVNPFVENAMLVVEKLPNDREDLRLFKKARFALPIAVFELSKGNLSKAEMLLDSVPKESQSVAHIFMRGFLNYQLARVSSNEGRLREAIYEFESLGSHDVLRQCNPALLGMAQYYIAGAELDLAKRQIRKLDSVDEVYAHLHKANNAISDARSNLDAIYYPALKSLAYEKSAEIYAALGEHEYSKGRELEYSALEDQAWLLSNS